MRGGPRRNKPTVMRILTGNAGKRKLPAHEPKAPDGVPDPPRHLTALERELWDYYAPKLAASRVVTLLDRDTLAQFCEARAQIDEIKAIQADPEYRRLLVSTQIDMLGNERTKLETNPLDVQRRAWTDKARLCAAELGLSPMSRARVHAAPGDGESTDPLENMMRRAK